MPLKVLIHQIPDRGAGRTILSGLKDAIEKDFGGQVIQWDLKDPTIFDKEQPDFYLADVRCHFELPQYLKEHRCKIACGTDQFPWSGQQPLFKELATEGYYTIQSHIDWIGKLNPDILFHCSHDSTIKISHAGWFEIGRKVVGFPLAGNPHQFHQFNESWLDRPLEVTYVGGLWPAKHIGVCAYLLPCIWYATTMIIGEGWPWGLSKTPHIDSKQLNDVWNNTKVAPCINQAIVRYNKSEHYQGMPTPTVDDLFSSELAERFYNSALCGCLVVTDSPSTVKKNLGEVDAQWFPSTSNVDEFHELIKTALIREPCEHIIKCLENQRRVILEGHCYHHRLRQLFGHVGINI